MIQANIMIRVNRVAKCHGYDVYFRVKTFGGLGKKSGRTRKLAKFKPILGRCAQFMLDFCV